MEIAAAARDSFKILKPLLHCYDLMQVVPPFGQINAIGLLSSLANGFRFGKNDIGR